MTAVFADTFYWVSLANPNDSAHHKATGFDLSRGLRPIVTTEEVLTEFLAFFASRGPIWRHKAVLVVRSIVADPTVTVQPQSHATFQAGLELYAERPDNGYSLTDCISIVTMRRQGLSDVLTNDRHFEQEGLRALFRTD